MASKNTTKTKKGTKRKTYQPKKRKLSSRQRKIKKYLDLLYQYIGRTTLIIFIGLILIALMYKLYVNYQDQQIEEPAIQHESDQKVKAEFVEAIVTPAQRLQRQYGVLASVSMAQAMLESDFGRSTLAAQYYNLFGVKTETSDPSGVDLPTKEFVNDEWITITARFKVYDSWSASMEEHAKLIHFGTSWDASHYSGVINATTYQAQAQALQDAGYATDPDYASKLIAMIETWQLYQYDQPMN